MSSRPGVVSSVLSVFLSISSATLVLSSIPIPAAAQDSLLTHPKSSAAPALEEATLVEKVKSGIASLNVDVGATLKLAELEIINGVTASLRYRYQVEPSYRGDYHLRMDKWTLKGEVKAGELFGDHENTPIGLNLSTGTEILFIRAFKDKGRAFKEAPYTPARMPFKAETVLKRLEVGDFVAFTTHLNLMVEARKNFATVTWPATLATHYLISGQFQVHVLKATDNKIRMKLIAIRKKEKGLSFEAGFGDKLKIIGLRIVDKQIQRIANIDTDILSMGISSEKSNLLLADYAMDLSKKQVTTAYNGLFSSILKFKHFTDLNNPFESSLEISDTLISDFTPIENIFEEERKKPNPADREIDRLMKITNRVDTSSKSHFRFSLLFAKFGQESEYTENGMTSIDGNDKETYYRLHTFSRTRMASFMPAAFREEGISRATILFGADQDLNITSIRDIVFEWDYRDKELKPKELQMVQEAAQQSLPQDVHRRINWSPWLPAKDRRDARVVMKMVLHPDSFGIIGAHSMPDLYQRFYNYVNSVPKPSSESVDPFKDETTSRPTIFHTVADGYLRDIEVVSTKLADVFNPNLSFEARSNAFAELRHVSLFIELGPGFLLSLLPQGDLERLLYVNFSMRAVDSPDFLFEYGKVPSRSVYDAAEYVQSVLNSREIDLALQIPRML